jgi:hypothetical protein
VERPASVRFRYWIIRQAAGAGGDGLLAVCVQHEVDHLNGVLFIDYLSKLKRDLVVRKFTKAAREKSASASTGSERRRPMPLRMSSWARRRFPSRRCRDRRPGARGVAAYSQPPAPAGRGMAERRSPVHEAARVRHSVHTPQTLRDPAVQAEFARTAAMLPSWSPTG